LAKENSEEKRKAKNAGTKRLGDMRGISTRTMRRPGAGEGKWGGGALSRKTIPDRRHDPDRLEKAKETKRRLAESPARVGERRLLLRLLAGSGEEAIVDFKGQGAEAGTIVNRNAASAFELGSSRVDLSGLAPDIGIGSILVLVGE
jgi:hypothetical protein